MFIQVVGGVLFSTEAGVVEKMNHYITIRNRGDEDGYEEEDVAAMNSLAGYLHEHCTFIEEQDLSDMLIACQTIDEPEVRIFRNAPTLNCGMIDAIRAKCSNPRIFTVLDMRSGGASWEAINIALKGMG